MALLHRFTQLNDRSNSGIFTFIVTKSVVRDPHRDATTKDFIYGWHRWCVTFTRANEKALGVYLILRNPCANSKCYADYSFTLLNKEHFSKNETVSDKQVLFNTQHPAQGVSKWILLTDISTRKFSDESGEFLLELSLSNILTIFEVDYNVANIQTLQRNFKLETNYVQYGGFDWTLSVKPNESDINNEEFKNLTEQTTVNVYLNRLTGHDRLVRVKYRLFLGNGKRKEDSGILDQISDGEGRIVGTQVNLFNLIETAKANKNTIRFYFEMYLANLISEAKVGIVREQAPVVNCYDRNKQAWSVESDFEKEHLRLKLFFMELESVPKNHLRFISFNLYVVTKNSRNDSKESISVLNGPHYQYYIADKYDTGVTMDTDIGSQLILKESPKDYLENDALLTVHIEWIDSIMLFNEKYHKYDDLTKMHCHQMRREIAALCAENYSMERQLFSFQKSISGVNSRNTPQPNLNQMHQYNSGSGQVIFGSGSSVSNVGHQSATNNSNGNLSQHRVSDPYILDNLTAPFSSLIKTGHQITSSSSNHPSPSHHSKSHPHPSLAQQPQMKSAAGTAVGANANVIGAAGGQQSMHQTPHQTQQPHHQSQMQQTAQFHSIHQMHSATANVTSQQTPTHLNKNPNLSSLTPQQSQQQSQAQQQIHQSQPSQMQSGQMSTLNSSIANMNLQNNYGVQANNSPTMTNQQQMTQHYQQQQQQQMSLNQMPINVNWQQQTQQQNINNPLLQQHQLPSINRSTGHLPAMNQMAQVNQVNPVTTSINPIFNYNTSNQMMNSSNVNSNLTGMPNEMMNASNQLSAGGGTQLNRHLSNSTCNLNASANYGGTNMTNTNSSNAGISTSANLMNNLNKPISSSNQNLNQTTGMMQYGRNIANGQQTGNMQRYQHNMNTVQPSTPQLPNYRAPINQPMMPTRSINYEDQRMYLQQQPSLQQPKSPLYNSDLNYS